MQQPEKLTHLVPVKLGDTQHEALVKACGGMRKRAEWIRARITEGLNSRRRNGALQVTHAEAKAMAEVRALGGKPVTILRAAIPGLMAR